MKRAMLSSIRENSAAMVLLFILTACSPATPTPEVTTATSTITNPPTDTPTVTVTPSPSLTPSPSPLPGPYVCSPLQDVPMDRLTEIITNPYGINTAGLDDGHHGTDFAFYRFDSLVGMAGLPIHSVMPGRVAAVVTDRLPYGNAVIIETPFRFLPRTWLDQMAFPRPGPLIEPQSAMNCPELAENRFMLKGEESLYLLYAHLQDLPAVKIGDRVGCGQEIGKVGTTGESVNDHLHLETRIGPSGVTFSSLAYYSTERTEEEALNYCFWRVSNIFHSFDPMELLAPGLNTPK